MKGQAGLLRESHPLVQTLEVVSNSDNQDSEPTQVAMRSSLTYFLPSL
jgi:hypothetical protein